MSIRIIGTGHCLPKTAITNDELAEFLDTSDEWISTRTGIKSRYVCTTEELSELAYSAAVNALDMANVMPQDIDTIICSTVCGDYLTPSMSCILNSRLGVSCRSFDVNGACSGFIYALEIAQAYIDSGISKRILLVSAESMSRLADWKDRATCVLFGDGAGAVVIEGGDDLLSIHVTSSGNKDILYIPSVSGNSPFDQVPKEQPFIHMNGKEVFKFAVTSISSDIKKVLTDAGVSEKDVNYVLLHQANLRIIDAAQKRIDISADKFLTNIDKCGNTSSASIPILLDEEARKGTFRKGDILVMSAFGGGLATGACVLKWGI